MVLCPLEFSDCYLDSPWFRKNIHKHEDELDDTNNQIKGLIKDAKSLISASFDQAEKMGQFSERLKTFKFDCDGQNHTDDEKRIAGSLVEFGLMLEEVSNEWRQMVERTAQQIIQPLEVFRKTHIIGYRDQKKLFDKASERYYKQLESTVGMSQKKKKEQQQKQQDSDNELLLLKKQFHKESLQYVFKLQEVQEKKKFEFVEYFVILMQGYFNYFRQSHEMAKDCTEYLKDIQVRLTTSRDQYSIQSSKTIELMKKMESNPEDHQNIDKKWSRAGHLFVLEKRLTSKWTKYFAQYSKENKILQLWTTPHSSGMMGGGDSRSFHLSYEEFSVTSCTRRSTDSIKERFCFDLEVEELRVDGFPGSKKVLTCQATSEVDRRKWLHDMDGKEPLYVNHKPKDFKNDKPKYELNDAGIRFVGELITEIERRGVDYEGIYRLVGVLSKVDLLLEKSLCASSATDKVDITNNEEWETNTLTSALKSYFRNLPEPVLTFNLHRDFINAAKLDSMDDRVKKVTSLVKQLPQSNIKVLSLLTAHLCKVEKCNDKNLMTMTNLGVCFGPTIMRDKEETMQSILEIKFSNIIAEIIIEHSELIFGVDKKDTAEAPVTKTQSTRTIARLPSSRRLVHCHVFTINQLY